MIKTDKGKGVVGVGSALVDILIHENDDFLEKAGASKGGMTYVDSEYIDQVLTRTTAKPVIVPGGSACNTIIGIGKLGGRARFVGKLGKDELGTFFETDLKKNAVEPVLSTSSFPTGRVLSIITPDAQRSMLTYLGAASEARADEVSDKWFEDAAIVHIEGYLLFNRDLMMATLNAAKQAGTLVSLDLASFTVVEASKDIIDGLVDDFVDILIANEDEASAFTGCTDEQAALEALSKHAEIAVLKVGSRGSFVSHNGEITTVAPETGGSIVDTTGAGDLWASGFLFGLINGWPAERCGKLASSCGYEVCQVVGANIPDEGWQRIKK